MRGTKVFFKDMYMDNWESGYNVHIKDNINIGDVYDLIDRFMTISTDSISDESAINVARRFSVYVDSSGYKNSINSIEDAFNQVYFDIVSGNISPSIDIGEELKLPTEGLYKGESSIPSEKNILPIVNKVENQVDKGLMNWEETANEIISSNPSLTDTVALLLESAMSPEMTEESKNAQIKLIELHGDIGDEQVIESIPVESFSVDDVNALVESPIVPKEKIGALGKLLNTEQFEKMVK